jgi:tetratricopeptide (TPR) repeat protein
VYYNGKDAYNEGMKSIDKSFVENYSLILPVNKYSDKEAARSAIGNMNRAVEKSAKCIRKHSITVRPKKDKRRKFKGKKRQRYEAFYNQKEFVKYIDDAYLLMGKSHLMKHDYFPAMEAFNFLIQEYSDKPVKFDGYLWLAKTYVEMGKMNKAKEILGQMEALKFKLPEHLEGEIALTYADIFIRETNYEEAIKKLKLGMESVTKKKEKARLNFILAQLYKEIKETQKAYKAFGECIDHNPNYEMVFNARINRASIFNSASGDSKDLQRELEKMLKDDKNYDFRDQIYYALASIAYNENRDNDAIDLYKKSTEVSTQNQNQKAISFLALADIYFDIPDYRNSQSYYDSSVVILDQNYPNFQQIKRKSENLNELVANLVTIETQDSLQRIAKMPENERVQFVDKIIAEVIEQERLQKEMEMQQQRDLLQMQQQNKQLESGSGKWYFYNPSMLGTGAAEFKKKWGNRKLEDNWRRKNKQVMDWGDADDETASTDSTQVYDNKSREYYLVNLPLSDSAMQVSQISIEEAYLNIATIYKEKFEDFQLSIEGYNELLERFPETTLKPQAWYNLYRLYYLSENYKAAEKYKTLIISEFPDTDYAKILSNPDYFKKLEEAENQLKFMYAATYRYFIAGNYEKVKYNFSYVDTAYKDSKLLPKFALLNTLCVGADKDTAKFEASLKQFITVFPQSDEAAYAQDVIAALNRNQREVLLAKEEEVFGGSTTAENDSIDITMFSYEPNAPHLYMAVVATEKASSNIIKFNLSNFNIDYYSFLDFEVLDEFISADYTAVVVKPFKNSLMAQNYLESVDYVETVFADMDEDAYRVFKISVSNFAKFVQDKNLLRYQKFYNTYYNTLEN